MSSSAPLAPAFKHLGLSDLFGCEIWLKDDSAIPFPGGGSTKVRKATAIFEDVRRAGADCVVTAGSPHSNHTRVVAALAKQHNLRSFIFIHDVNLDPSLQFLSFLLEHGADVALLELEGVQEAMESKVEELRLTGRRPFSIYGGGHSTSGAFGAYLGGEELAEQGDLPWFEAICVASGTGGTQAGLHCSASRVRPSTRCIGISIARAASKGRRVVDDLVRELDAHLGATATIRRSCCNLFRSCAMNISSKQSPPIRARRCLGCIK